MSYIDFKSEGLSPSGKTYIWKVFGQNRFPIAIIKWHGAWRKYVVQPIDAIFDATCLREIADFCEDMTRKHNAS